MITRTSASYATGSRVETVETLFVGATLALHYNSTRVMSDIWESLPYATVFDGTKVTVVHRDNGGTVDATPEVIAAANAWLLTAATAKRKAGWDERVAKAVAAAHKVEKGKMVTVVKGRKVKKGTSGEVFWVGAGKAYGYYDRPSDRIGIRDADGAVHWTAASNVEVINADDAFDFDLWVTNEPDHAAEALEALNAPADPYGRKYAEVTLGAGEDRIGFSGWFTVAAPVAAAA